MTDAFGHWLAGFVDGEGCFSITQPHAYKRSCRCDFTITLRDDDGPILEEIQKQLGVGRLSRHVRKVNPKNGKPQARYSVATKRETLVIVGTFDRFPLRAKKAK